MSPNSAVTTACCGCRTGCRRSDSAAGQWIDHVGLEHLTADGQAMSADPNHAATFYTSAFALPSFG
ncbi:hypothetical protein ACIOJE_04480 [Kitasatospora sp. NPDC087861]|uniref:hypothetical protein n=1 Tax=Kitasatospora sp. NPDC087861 TaxID=3364070 RepID=UPI0037F6C108